MATIHDALDDLKDIQPSTPLFAYKMSLIQAKYESAVLAINLYGVPDQIENVFGELKSARKILELSIESYLDHYQDPAFDPADYQESMADFRRALQIEPDQLGLVLPD
ncbi:hypothetical protein IV38_GL001098 [Lactobacillus selangorensis]|uniref:Uncharacterized protein n=2 Tax=Lactobacillus selangorensis TaxID=81857 RepID=A0A0R2G647_9LACO|nr:hypothetical protein IV38_GL001098 [Lactobacillus selangorensis]KRN32700.1 hypothetical protein IV40_GL000755 [Lactobacillus selangorensis]